MIFAVAVFKFIIKNRGSLEAFLFGFGLVIPLALYIPFFLLEELDIQNKSVKLGLTTLPVIVCFHTVEAMFSTPSSIVVEATMGNYIAYYTTLCHFEWSTKTLKRRKITSVELLVAVFNLLVGFFRISFMLSFMMHFNFQPFQSQVKLDDYHMTFDLLSPAHLANTYLLAILTYSYLSFGFHMTAFSEQAKGYYIEPLFLNPMLLSRSIGEFWGKRWNLMIHRFLKHGVMRPAKKYYSTPISIFLAFVFSGLLHDYTWAIVFYHHSRDECATCSDCDHCFHFKPLKVSVFFFYCGLCLLLERPLSPYLGFFKTWPTVIVSQLVLLTGCPVRVVSAYIWNRVGLTNPLHFLNSVLVVVDSF